MANYQAKDSLVLGRQLEVQHLVIPFQIVGSATSASVVFSCDEPGFVFAQTNGTNQITAAVPSTDTATFTTSPSDSAGTFNCLVLINEQLVKLCQASVNVPATAVVKACALGSATGISVNTASGANGVCLMLSVPTGSAYNTSGTVSGCLEIDYITAE